MGGVGGVLQDPNPEKKRYFDQKAVGKHKKPLNLAVDTSYPPPLPQVGGWSEVTIQKNVIGVGKNAFLPPLGFRLLFI